jgi:hypothetical protein
MARPCGFGVDALAGKQLSSRMASPRSTRSCTMNVSYSWKRNQDGGVAFTTRSSMLTRGANLPWRRSRRVVTASVSSHRPSCSLAVRAAFETIQAHNRLALFRHHAIQLNHLSEQPDHQSLQLGG